MVCDHDQTVNHLPVFGEGLEHKKICPVCSNNKSKSRAQDIYHVLHGFEWENLGNLVLTTPSDWVDQSRLDDCDYILERQEDLNKCVQTFFKRFFPDVPSVRSFHSWHSTNPISGSHFHVHTLFPRTRYQRKKDGLIWVIEQSAMLEPEALEQMREFWSDLMSVEVADIWYQFIPRKDSERVIHQLRYMFRGYIEDVNKWLLKYRSEGDLYDMNGSCMSAFVQVQEWRERQTIEWHLRVWKRRTRYYGAWSPSQVALWIDKEIVEKRIEQTRQESQELFCRTCLCLLIWKSREKTIGGDGPFNPKQAVFRRRWEPREPPDSCMLIVRPFRRKRALIPLPNSHPKYSMLKPRPLKKWLDEKHAKHVEWMRSK